MYDSIDNSLCENKKETLKFDICFSNFVCVEILKGRIHIVTVCNEIVNSGQSSVNI
jgi:hypothetical protein